MTADQNNKIIALSFAGFGAIFFFTFALLMVVSAGVFVALGITSANDPRDSTPEGIAVLGGAFAVVFYVVLSLIFVLPLAIASWKMLKRRRRARMWGIIAAILVLPVFPLGTVAGIFGLSWFFNATGRDYYLNFATPGADSVV